MQPPRASPRMTGAVNPVAGFPARRSGVPHPVAPGFWGSQSPPPWPSVWGPVPAGAVDAAAEMAAASSRAGPAGRISVTGRSGADMFGREPPHGRPPVAGPSQPCGRRPQRQVKSLAGCRRNPGASRDGSSSPPCRIATTSGTPAPRSGPKTVPIRGRHGAAVAARASVAR